MKKFLLTMVVAASATLMASAQSTRTLEQAPAKLDYQVNAKAAMPQQSVQEQRSATSRVVTMQDVVAQQKQRKLKADETTVEALYNFPNAAFYEGPFYQDGSIYTYYRQDLYVKAREQHTWPNYSTFDSEQDVTFTWLSGTTELSQDEYGNGLASIWGANYVPSLTVEQGEQSSTYQFSYTAANGNVYPAVWFSNTDSISNLYNFTYQRGFYTGWSSGEGWKGNEPFFDEEQKAIGFAQYVQGSKAHVYAEGIQAFMYDASNEENPLGDGALYATLYTVGEDGSLEALARGVATQENVTGQGQLLIQFPFVEEDETMGLIETPIALPEQDMLLTITGFENISTTLALRFGAANGFNGYAYGILEDGSLSSLYYSNSNVPAYNLYIGLTARTVDVELYDPETVVTFPTEGGYGYVGEGVDEETGETVLYNDIDFYSSVPYDEWYVVEAPEWVTGFEYNTDYFSNGYLLWYFSADALPEGEEGREGEVVFEVYGKQFAVKVQQGNVETGITDVTKGNLNSHAPVYNLAGQRVDKNAKGLLIQNGRKFIRK